MGAFQTKMKWLILPAQSGKTRKAEDRIRLMETLNRKFNPGKPGELNIWISANNKLLVYQTTSRIKKDLGAARDSSDEEGEEGCDAVINGKIFSWTSGNKNTNISIGELARAVTRGDDKRVDMILMCAHPSRIRYLSELLEDVCSDIGRRISIWIDEADRTIPMWIKYASIMHHPAIRCATMISATFSAAMEKFGKVSILPYTESDIMPPCYRSLKDCMKIIEDGHGKSVDYVRAIINKHKTKLTAPGVRAFIPGDISKRSHDEIATMLVHEYGFAVLILNGEHKEIRFPDQEKIPLRPYLNVRDPDNIPDEFNKQLACMYVDREIYKYPLAITGMMCVERGVTFQSVPQVGIHNGFLFDYAIIPPMTNDAEAYQTMARMFGNIGHHPEYEKSDIYSDSHTFDRVMKEETLAINIARIVEMYDLREVGQHEISLALGHGSNMMIDQDDFKDHWDEFTPSGIHHHPEFADYLQKLEMEDGFYKASISQKAKVLTYDEVIKVRTGRKTAQLRVAADTMMVGEEHAQRRNYVAYRDLSDPSSVVYFIRKVWRVRMPVSIEDRVRERAVVSGNPF